MPGLKILRQGKEHPSYECRGASIRERGGSSIGRDTILSPRSSLLSQLSLETPRRGSIRYSRKRSRERPEKFRRSVMQIPRRAPSKTRHGLTKSPDKCAVQRERKKRRCAKKVRRSRVVVAGEESRWIVLPGCRQTGGRDDSRKGTKRALTSRGLLYTEN